VFAHWHSGEREHGGLPCRTLHEHKHGERRFGAATQAA
jgi:hypothetical protein